MENENKIIVFILVFLVFFSGGMFFVVKYSQRIGYEEAIQRKVDQIFNIKGEMKFRKVEFEPEIDYESVTDLLYRIGADKGVECYQPFKQHMRMIHFEILNFVSESLDLPADDRAKIREFYEQRCSDLNNSLYQQLLEKNESILVDSDATIIAFSTYKCAKNLEEVLSSNICAIAGYILTLSKASSTKEGIIGAFMGKPCGYILEKALKPLAKYIKDQAIIKDYSSSIVKLETHIRDNLVELATVEDTIDLNWDETYCQTIFGITVSESKLGIQVSSKIKAGFDLDKCFEIKFDHKNKSIIVTLPEPEILSIDPDQKIEELENGLLKKIGKDELNSIMQKTRIIARNRAIRKGILVKARGNSDLVIRALINPIIVATDQYYKIEVRFAPHKAKPRITAESKDRSDAAA